MRQVSLIALVSLLALFMGGCPASEDNEQATQNTPVPSATAPPARRKPLAAPFPSPLAPKQPGNNTAVPGLVQTAPPDSVAKQIAKGRSDPFAAIPVQPEVTVSQNPGGGNTNRPVPEVPPIAPPATQRQPGGATKGGGGKPSASSRGNAPRSSQQRQNPRSQGSIASRPGSSQQGPIAFRPRPGTAGLPPVGVPSVPPPPPFTPSLPRLPEPTLAKSVQVTGVVVVGGVPTAIVKVPNEPDRYVQEGQRLLNGQVLVKRIEINRGPTPVVVLEQYGIEVAKQVGERPAGSPENPESPTASLPVLTPGITTAST